MAFAIWILNAYFSSIPARSRRRRWWTAAAGSGCCCGSRCRWRPRPGHALIFTFIAAWNEFIAALTLTTSNSATPLTVRLDSFIGQYTVDWQHLFGASVVATIPVVILFALIERRVVAG